LSKAKDDLKKLAKAHLALKNSSKGIDSEGSPLAIRAKLPRIQKENDADAVETLQDIIKGDIKFDDIIK